MAIQAAKPGYGIEPELGRLKTIQQGIIHRDATTIRHIAPHEELC